MRPALLVLTLALVGCASPEPTPAPAPPPPAPKVDDRARFREGTAGVDRVVIKNSIDPYGRGPQVGELTGEEVTRFLALFESAEVVNYSCKCWGHASFELHRGGVDVGEIRFFNERADGGDVEFLGSRWKVTSAAAIELSKLAKLR